MLECTSWDARPAGVPGDIIHCFISVSLWWTLVRSSEEAVVDEEVHRQVLNDVNEEPGVIPDVCEDDAMGVGRVGKCSPPPTKPDADASVTIRLFISVK